MTQGRKLDAGDYRRLAIACAGALLNLGFTEIEVSEDELQKYDEGGLGSIGLTVEHDIRKRVMTIRLSGESHTSATIAGTSVAPWDDANTDPLVDVQRVRSEIRDIVAEER